MGGWDDARLKKHEFLVQELVVCSQYLFINVRNTSSSTSEGRRGNDLDAWSAEPKVSDQKTALLAWSLTFIM